MQMITGALQPSLLRTPLGGQALAPRRSWGSVARGMEMGQAFFGLQAVFSIVGPTWSLQFPSAPGLPLGFSVFNH